MESAAGRGRMPARGRLLQVISITVAVIIGVGVAAYLVGRSAGRPSAPASYGVADLPARNAGPDFAPIDRAHQIPGNVLAALVVPAHSRVVGRANHDRGIDTYDRSVTYVTSASTLIVRQFFPAALAHRQWRIVSTANPVIARHAGSDGNYWEAGITTKPRPGGAGTTFTLRVLLYQGEA